jgi:hypothetical protein
MRAVGLLRKGKKMRNALIACGMVCAIALISCDRYILGPFFSGRELLPAQAVFDVAVLLTFALVVGIASLFGRSRSRE